MIKYYTPYAKLSHGSNYPLTNEIIGIWALRTIEHIGRVSHRSEDKQTEDSYKRFIPAVVLQHGDWSITEHAFATVEFLVDRGISHEIVRHRIASYTQESTRFVNYRKTGEYHFIIPASIEEKIDSNDINEFKLAMELAVGTYADLIANGSSPQIARSVLPNALATRLYMTANLRSWRNFLIKRTTLETHPEMRRVTGPLLQQFQGAYPFLYDDIEFNQRQSEALKKGM